MKNKLKLLAVLVAMMALSWTAAAGEVIWADFTYELNDDGKSCTFYGKKGYTPAENFVIPKQFRGLPVTVIGKGACSGWTFKTVTIPDTVTSIEKGAFYKCEKLESIVIPEKVTTIGNDAFSYCKSLERITIPASVTSIGELAFESCVKLESVTFAKGSKLKTIGVGAFQEDVYLESVDIPSGVTSIPRLAFWNCILLSRVTIPEGVATIGDRAFSECSSLESVVIPASVTTIDRDAFLYCENLESVTFAKGSQLQTIEDGAFEYCPLKSITIPESVTRLSGFGNNTFTEFTIPKNVTSLSMISECPNLETVTFAPGIALTRINGFFNCPKLKNLVLPDSVTSVDGGGFFNCDNLLFTEYENAFYLGTRTNPYYVLCKGKDYKITSCKIHEDTKIIADAAFENREDMKSLTIPEGVVIIGDSVFCGCTQVESFTIPASVTSIGGALFYAVVKLKNINYAGTKAQWTAVQKGENWHRLSSARYLQTVTCSNGKVTLGK